MVSKKFDEREKNMLCINEELTYRRIGKKIYIIKNEENQELLYEFDGDAFNILNGIIFCGCDNLEKVKKYLAQEYIFEGSEDETINEFICELEKEGIILVNEE